MANVARPLKHWMRWHRHCCFGPTSFHPLLHSPHLTSSINATSLSLSFTTTPSPHRTVHFRSRGVRLSDAPVPSDFQESDSESDSDSTVKKSRNEKKREARRAVRWGMELSAFSTPQIKRILRAASLEPEVFEALMVVKRLGRDVREGKRRQFNYIGRLLREAEPELMDTLIQATKDGDHSKLQALSGPEANDIEDDEGVDETESEEEEVGLGEHIDTANRWFDGLISKDIDITKEIYSIQSVEFDRQELRKLVRKLQSAQERQLMSEENDRKTEAALSGARRGLNRFLRDLAKRLPAE